MKLSDIGVITVDEGGSTEWVPTTYRMPNQFECNQFNYQFYVLLVSSDEPTVLCYGRHSWENVEYWLRIKPPPRPEKTLEHKRQADLSAQQDELGQELEDFLGM
jgi:hypothetical protein